MATNTGLPNYNQMIAELTDSEAECFDKLLRSLESFEAFCEQQQFQNKESLQWLERLDLVHAILQARALTPDEQADLDAIFMDEQRFLRFHKQWQQRTCREALSVKGLAASVDLEAGFKERLLRLVALKMKNFSSTQQIPLHLSIFHVVASRGWDHWEEGLYLALAISQGRVLTSEEQSILEAVLMNAKSFEQFQEAWACRQGLGDACSNMLVVARMDLEKIFKKNFLALLANKMHSFSSPEEIPEHLQVYCLVEAHGWGKTRAWDVHKELYVLVKNKFKNDFVLDRDSDRFKKLCANLVKILTHAELCERFKGLGMVYNEGGTILSNGALGGDGCNKREGAYRSRHECIQVEYKEMLQQLTSLVDKNLNFVDIESLLINWQPKKESKAYFQEVSQSLACIIGGLSLKKAPTVKKVQQELKSNTQVASVARSEVSVQECGSVSLVSAPGVWYKRKAFWAVTATVAVVVLAAVASVVAVAATHGLAAPPIIAGWWAALKAGSLAAIGLGVAGAYASVNAAGVIGMAAGRSAVAIADKAPVSVPVQPRCTYPKMSWRDCFFKRQAPLICPDMQVIDG